MLPHGDHYVAAVALSRYEHCHSCHVLAVNAPMDCLEKFVDVQNQLNQISMDSQRSFINPDKAAGDKAEVRQPLPSTAIPTTHPCQRLLQRLNLPAW